MKIIELKKMSTEDLENLRYMEATRATCKITIGATRAKARLVVKRIEKVLEERNK